MFWVLKRPITYVLGYVLVKPCKPKVNNKINYNAEKEIRILFGKMPYAMKQ